MPAISNWINIWVAISILISAMMPLGSVNLISQSNENTSMNTQFGVNMDTVIQPATETAEISMLQVKKNQR